MWCRLWLDCLCLQLIGNISTALIVVICYFNFLLFENYLRLIVWAILFSQALRQAKNNVVSVLQYLSDDPDVDKYVRLPITACHRVYVCCPCVYVLTFCIDYHLSVGLLDVRVLQVVRDLFPPPA